MLPKIASCFLDILGWAVSFAFCVVVGPGKKSPQHCENVFRDLSKAESSCPCKSCNLYRVIMVYYGLLWSIMIYYGLLWSIMFYYGLLWSSLVYYGLLWSIMV